MAEIIGSDFTITLEDTGGGSQLTDSWLYQAAAALAPGASVNMSLSGFQASWGYYGAWADKGWFDPVNLRLLFPSKNVTTNPHNVFEYKLLPDSWARPYSDNNITTNSNSGHPDCRTALDYESGFLVWTAWAGNKEIRRWDNVISTGNWENISPNTPWSNWGPPIGIQYFARLNGTSPGWLIMTQGGQLFGVRKSDGAIIWNPNQTNMAGGYLQQPVYSRQRHIGLAARGGTITPTSGDTAYLNSNNPSNISMPTYLIQGQTTPPTVVRIQDAPCYGSSPGIGPRSGTNGWALVAYKDTFLCLEMAAAARPGHAFRMEFPTSDVPFWTRIADHPFLNGTASGGFQVASVDECSCIVGLSWNGNLNAVPSGKVWRPY